jgi:hypothetical protein
MDNKTLRQIRQLLKTGFKAPRFQGFEGKIQDSRGRGSKGAKESRGQGSEGKIKNYRGLEVNSRNLHCVSLILQLTEKMILNL